MHLRRHFSKSLSLIDTKGLDCDTVEGLPEVKVLKLIGEICNEDEPLKTLSAEERKYIRKQRVNPLMNEIYKYLDSLNVTNPLLSGRMRDAVHYAKNQKEYICRFLDDGFTEPAIRPFTIGGNNRIACGSIAGAETVAIIYKIVETTKANKVNVYHYLRYLLEQVPKHLDGKNLDFLDAILPWSDNYL